MSATNDLYRRLNLGWSGRYRRWRVLAALLAPPVGYGRANGRHQGKGRAWARKSARHHRTRRLLAKAGRKAAR